MAVTMRTIEKLSWSSLNAGCFVGQKWLRAPCAMSAQGALYRLGLFRFPAGLWHTWSWCLLANDKIVLRNRVQGLTESVPLRVEL